MIYYFFILFYWLLLFEFGTKEKSYIRLFYAILPLYLIMALRSVSVGSDTISYYNRYIGAFDMLTADHTISEPGYNLLSYFFHDILGVPFWVLVATLSLFQCYILGLFLKHFSVNIYFSLFLFMTIGLFTPAMSGLRQLTAVSICTIPVIWAKVCDERGNENNKHKMWRLIIGIGLVLVAYTIHNSAIIFMPILFLFDKRLSRQQTIAIMIFAVSTLLFRSLLVRFMGYFVLERYDRYDLNEGYMMNILMLLVPISIGLFCVFTSSPEKGEQKYSKAMSLMFLFLALQVTFNNLALSQNQVARLGYYFMNSYIVLIPYVLKKLPAQSRSITTFCIIFLCIVFFYMGTNGGTLKIDNYKFFWEEPIYLNN